MNNKDIIKLINEEFDFLNNDQYTKEKETLDLIQNEDFQKQFLIDSIIKREKIKLNVTDARVTGDWQDRESGNLGIEYYTEVEYAYDSDKEPSKFILAFDGTNVAFTTKTVGDEGDYDTPPSKDQWFDDIQWTDINVSLNTFDGDEIPFKAYEKAPDKIKNVFIKNYLLVFLQNETDMEVK